MRNTIHSLIAILALSFWCMACTSTPKSNAFIADYIGEDLDSLSFDEIKATVAAVNVQLSFFSGLSKAFGGDDEKPKDYKEEDENVVDPLQLGGRLTKTDFEKAITFSQTADYPNSELRIDMGKINESAGDGITYYIDRIYYADGTSDSINSSISRSYDAPLKVIDSVTITVRYRHTTAINTVNISKSNKKASYKDGEIHLESIDKNYVQYYLSDNISGSLINAQALTPSGNLVSSRSSSSGSYPPEKGAKLFDEAAKRLNKICEKIVANKYANKEDLIDDINDQFSGFEPSDRYYQSEYYAGNVEEVVLYMIDTKETEDYVLTFPVRSNIGRFNIIKNDSTNLRGIVDNTGKVIAKPIYKNLEQVNDYFYTSVDYYNDLLLLLNDSTHTLQTIGQYKPRNIEYLNNDLALLTYRGKCGILDRYAKAIVAPIYDNIKNDELNRVIIARTEDAFALYSMEGKLLLSEKGYLGDFSTSGWAIYQKEYRKPYCFISIKGEKGLVISQYTEVEPFEDNLAMVSKDRKYGFIRPDGSLAIPLIYDDADSFSDGITIVKQNGRVGLINTKNEFILPLEDYGGISVSTNFGKRTYSINGQNYNSKGEAIPND